ncbi:MAG TPA: M56 family metallopeptidase [Candidatus Eubacterium avistercoris]|uniref:M56 family metallopeptidase n=1 Tax=Candidatus Eubacterium avistercoris TaxID=2838567 RepID=A0A9D2IFJ8_9FIRM|nr:M56 family metallopeptidase [Candidatus Eubacterium avistercoris]
MVWQNNLFFLLALNGITGNAAFGLSCLLGSIAAGRGCAGLVYRMQKGVVFFFLIPAGYMFYHFRNIVEVNEHLYRFDGNTATAYLFQRIFMIWLAGTIVVGIIYLFRYLYLLKLKAANIPLKDEKITADFYSLYEDKRLKKTKICTNYFVKSPCIIGIRHPVLVIPEGKEYKPYELSIILAHEATHVVHRDNLWKMLALLIVIFCWWNPFLYLFLHKLDAWAETYCDITVCKNFLNGDRQFYASVLLNVALGKDLFMPPVVSLFNGTRAFTRRIKRLSKVNGKKLGKKALLSVILSAVFVAGSGFTAFAAGTEASKIGQDMYEDTIETKESVDEGIGDFEGALENDNYIEYRLAPGEWDADDVTILQMSPDEGETMLMETTKSFSWSVPSGSVCSSGNFLKRKNTDILVSCYVESSSNVRVGIIEPDGTLVYVLGKGQVAHVFSCNRFGFYKVAVQNITSKTISVTGYYRR